MKFFALILIIITTQVSIAGVHPLPTPTYDDNTIVLNPNQPGGYVPGNELLGRWRATNVQQGDGVQFHLSFNFTNNQATMTVTCNFIDGVTLRATSSSAAYYAGQQIYIQQAQQNTTQDGNRYCRSTLQPSRWDAYVNGYGRMNLIIPVPYQSLNLIRY